MRHAPAPHGIASYLGVYAALLVLTGVTVWLPGLELGPYSLSAALGVATIKVALVGAVFMHLRGSSPLHALCLAGGLFWVFVLIGMTLGDYATRPSPPVAPAGYEPPAALVGG